MNLTTVNVAISLQQLIGAPLPGGSVRFELTRADINGALVLPKAVTVALPADGSTPTARLWPNTLGTQGSQTKVTVLDQAGVEQFSGLATIPATDCNLHDVMNLQAPPVLSDAQAAALTAQAAAAAALQAAVDAAAVHADRLAADASAAAAAHIYASSYAADPTTRPDGSARQVGDEYFNSVANLTKRFNGATWVASDINTANLAATTGATLVGFDGTTVAGAVKDRLFRRVADVVALRALDKTKYTAARVTTYPDETGASASDYLYDALDTTSAESLPNLVVAADGGRWKLSSPMMPAPQDALPIAQIARDLGDRYVTRLPRQVGIAADLGQVNVELPLHIGTRRNLWQFTGGEEFSSNRYSTTLATKQTDTVTVDGITLARLSCANFYSNINTNFSGLGLAPFVAGERYLMSFYILNRNPTENFFWMRTLANGSSPGHGAKLAVPGSVRRVWQVVQAVSTSAITHITTPTLALGSEAGDNMWFQLGSTEGGAMEAYVGGFMIEKLASNTYKDGIAVIGDSTMEGASGVTDSVATGAREVSVWLGALLNVNVFNRANGGERTDQMDARWATDISPLAINCKYAIIQGGINDIGQGRTLAQIQTSIDSMVTKAIADGLIPVLFTCTPTASIAAVAGGEAVRQQLNAWMRTTYPRVIDIAQVVADPHNPAYLRRMKNWYGDGIHYPSAGKRAVASYVAQWNGWDFVTPSPYQPVVGAVYTPPGSALTHNGLQVVGARDTGWTAGTGTPSKGAFAADTATTTQTAQRLLALEQMLRTHGLMN